MRTFFRSRMFWMTLVSLVLLVLMISVARYFFALVEDGKKNPHLPSVPLGREREAAPDTLPDIRGTQSIIAPQSNFNGPIIRYKDHRFAPATSTVHYHPATSCVIQIINESSAPLIIRLSPHASALKGNHGGQYEPIPPGGLLNLDPRFDMTRPAFHNHEQPKEEFTLFLDRSCRNDL